MYPDSNNQGQTHGSDRRKDWRIYNSLSLAWDEIVDDCKKATRNIDIEQYIFENDNLGNQLLGILKAKAKEGIKVRLLCDTAGSFSLYRSTLLFGLQSAGIELVFFNTFVPVIFRSHFTWWFFRDHRKLIVIDKEIAYTGSFCIWEKTFFWRDTIVRIQGQVVEEMQESFDAMWYRAKRRPFPEFHKRLPAGIEGFNFITNTPRPNKRELYYRTVEAIRHAREYIFIEVPYFAPDRRLMRIIRLAKKRGVDVRIILPAHCDYQIVDFAARSYFEDLLREGVRIFLYSENFLHSKAIVIDNSWATVGSMNLDNLSITYNFEANLISTDKIFIHEIKEQFIIDQSNAVELTYKDWQRRSLKNKILEWLVKLIRKFL